MQSRKLFAVTVVAFMLVTLMAPMMTAEAGGQSYDQFSSYRCKPKPPPVVEPKIEFLGWERSQSGVVFCYKVTAGSKDVSNWMLFSPVFKTTKLLGTSERPYEYNQKQGYIKFEKGIKAGQSREICFELALNYNGFKIDNINYQIKAGTKLYCGKVDGPLFSSGYTLPHT